MVSVNLSELFGAFERIGSTRSRNEKMEILREIKESSNRQIFLELCELTFNPYKTYGTTVKRRDELVEEVCNVDKAFRHPDAENDLWETFKSLMSRLAWRDLTGHAAKDACADFIAVTGSYGAWFARLINCSWGIGLGATSIWKEFPELKDMVPTFSCGLCQEFNPETDFEERILSPWFIEPKLDGLRGIIGKFDGPVESLSRNGKPLWNADRMVDLIAACFPGFVFDGEFFAEDWSKTMSICKTQSPHKEAEGLRFWVFDALPREEWLGGFNYDPLWQRKNRLEAMVYTMNKAAMSSFGYEPFVFVPTFPSKDPEEIKMIMDTWLNEGFEGVVLKHYSSTYQFDRGDSWLKWKPYKSDDCRILEISGAYRNDITGEIHAVIPDDLRHQTWTPVAATVKVIAENGIESNVGTGYDLETRKLLWKDREKMVGEIIEVRYQEYTPDGAMRFPRFLRFRTDKE